MSEAVQSADFLSIGKAIMDGIIAAMDGKATALYAKARQIAKQGSRDDAGRPCRALSISRYDRHL